MTPALEKRVIRRISLRIIPFIMLLYFIAYIDRVNIGFAALTMNKDLGFSSSVFGLALASFSSVTSCSKCRPIWCLRRSAPGFGSPASW